MHPGPVLSATDQRGRWSHGERLEAVFEYRCDRLRLEAPTQLAVDNGTGQLTYDQLDASANRLARHLSDNGIGPGDRVGLIFDDPVRSYVAILAVLKVQAAYVPLDPAFPSDRIGYIVEDAGVGCLLSLSHLQELLSGVPVPVLCLDKADAAIALRDGSRLSEAEKGTPSDDLAYIIYTSGSTGRPKGVAVEHSSICNFVRVAGEVYGYRTDDRVYQGMTIAFDFSMEEMWVPWSVGATLVPKPGGASLLGAELGRYLVEHQVTALCCVPTLLATLEEDLPDLRFLLVSGEACPRDLVARWHRPGLRFLNVYGPTEATVTATWDIVHPDKAVTLGVPLPTYSAVILDPDHATALQVGDYGEIGIAGVGLALEYVNRPEQTSKAFIPDFLDIAHNPSGRIYRTGDLGRFTEDGLIEYAGRIDTQVKIRGYRIELSEIESVILEISGVAQAVVDTYQPPAGSSTELVAYYTLRPGAADTTDRTIHEQLRLRLPAYMVPSYYERLDVIPMLPSDKADRKNLPPPTRRLSLADGADYVGPQTDTEQVLAAALGQVLGAERISVDAHFFDDLGANSLLLAHFSARVRKDTDLPPLAMQDIYENPTIRQLALALTDALPTSDSAMWPDPEPENEKVRVGTPQIVLCGALQVLVSLGYAYFMVWLMLVAFRWAASAEGIMGIWWRSIVFGLGTFVVMSAVPILLKWLIIGRWKEAEFPVWSLRYVRFWFVRALVNTNPLRAFAGSPIFPFYLRALGARIGPNVSIFSTTVPVCTDLLTIGAGTAIRKDSQFLCYRAHDGQIQTGPVTIGADVLIGEMSMLDIHTSMGDGSQLGHVSSLQRGQAVPAGSSWHGSPGRPTDTDYRVVPAADCGTWRRVAYSAFILLNRLVLVAPVGLALLAMFLYDYLDMGHLNHARVSFYLDAALLSLVLYIGGLVAGLIAVVTVPRALNLLFTQGRVYPLYGFHYAMHRTVTRLTNLEMFLSLTGDSSLIVHYLKLLGYRQPNLIQSGTNFGPMIKHETPFGVTIGSGTMVADGLSIVNANYSSTSFQIAPVLIGATNFFGNGVVYPAGAHTGDNVLFGTKTMVPIDGPVREHVGLLGSPPFEIPRSVDRDGVFDDLSPEQLRSGLRGKNWHNGVTLAIFMTSQWFLGFVGLIFASIAAATFRAGGAAAILAVVLAFALFQMVLSILWEWASLGFKRLVPRFCSIYDLQFWQHERYWKFVAGPPAWLAGTPMRPFVWRLYGVRMGRRVFDDGLSVPEKTIVTIGDECTFNPGSIIQCHSMEDGAFKLDGVTVGSRVTLGVEAFVHYGVTMHDGAVLEMDSFLMKGTEVPEHGRFGGNPARELRPAPPPVAG